MLASEKIAIAAHLHVLLRRKSGRVTDTEWMATNREYASEIIRFSKEKAVEDGHADLAEWADKLATAMGLTDTPETPRRMSPIVIQRDDAQLAGSTGLSRYIRGLR
jgi:hypothetical protein